jgi:paired small multidrug resistance pump
MLVIDLNYHWHDVLGNLGVLTILLCYLFAQLDRWAVTAPSYSIANALGAALILISLLVDFNLSAFMMEAAWLLISIYALLRRRRQPLTEST